MKIDAGEQLELAELIARRIVQGMGLLGAQDEMRASASRIAWDAIEDFTGKDDGPDILTMAKTKAEAE